MTVHHPILHAYPSRQQSGSLYVVVAPLPPHTYKGMNPESGIPPFEGLPKVGSTPGRLSIIHTFSPCFEAYLVHVSTNLERYPPSILILTRGWSMTRTI